MNQNTGFSLLHPTGAGAEYRSLPDHVLHDLGLDAPDVYADPDHFGVSVADCAYHAANGSAADCGIDLAEKVYEKTE